MVNLQKSALIYLKFINSIVFFILITNFFGFSQTPGVLDYLNNYESPIVLCWKNAFNQRIDFNVASDNIGNLYLSNYEGKLVSIYSLDGKKNWETDLGGEIVSAPVIDSDNVYILISHNKVPFKYGKDLRKNLLLRSLNKITGLTIWEQNFELNSKANSKIYFYLYADFLVSFSDHGDIQAINRTNGQVSWKKNLNQELVALPFAHQDKIFAGMSDNRILILSLIKGDIMEEITTVRSPVTILYDPVRNNLLWGDIKGNVFSFNLILKRLNWQSRKGAEISNIVFTARGLLITSLDNFIYLISYKSGDLIWKKRLDGRISAKPLVNLEYAIVTTIADPIAIIINLRNGKTINNIILERDNLFINDHIKYRDILIYSTLKGIYAFSPRNGCQSRETQN